MVIQFTQDIPDSSFRKGDVRKVPYFAGQYFIAKNLATKYEPKEVEQTSKKKSKTK